MKQKINRITFATNCTLNSSEGSANLLLVTSSCKHWIIVSIQDKVLKAEAMILITSIAGWWQMWEVREFYLSRKVRELHENSLKIGLRGEKKANTKVLISEHQ